MTSLAETITNYYIKKNIIPVNKRAVYQYGFQLIIADIINFSLVLMSGAVIGRFFHSILFLITLCSVRRYTGGFHAKSFWLCRLSMIITFICVTALTEILSRSQQLIPLIITIDIICILFISAKSPVEHPNKPLTPKQKRTNRIHGIISSFLLSTASVVLAVIKVKESVTITISLLAVVILMVIGMAVTKGVKK